MNPGYILVDNKNYPTIAEDYQKCFKVLQSLPVDLFLGAHGGYYGMNEKYERLKTGGSQMNPFADPDGYHRYVEERFQTFEKELEKQRGK